MSDSSGGLKYGQLSAFLYGAGILEMKREPEGPAEMWKILQERGAPGLFWHF